ncbi:protein of unknown function (DUF4291) domain containing protein [Rhypophila sp. PSN 637]
MSSSSSSSSTTEAHQPTPYKQIRAHLSDSTSSDSENESEQTITVYQAYNRTIAEAAVSSQKLNASPKFKVNSRMTWIKPSWGWMLYRSGYSYKDPGQERILALKMRLADFWGLLRRAELTHTSEARFVGVRARFLGDMEGSSAGKEPILEEGLDAQLNVEADGDCSEDANPTRDGDQRQSNKEETSKGQGQGRGRGRANRRDKRKLKEQRTTPNWKEKSGKVKVQWDPERSIRLERLDYRSIQIGIPGSLTEKWCEEMIVGIEDVTDKARELKRVLDLEADRPWEWTELKELVRMGLVPVEREVQVPEDIRVLLGMDLPEAVSEEV